MNAEVNDELEKRAHKENFAKTSTVTVPTVVYEIVKRNVTKVQHLLPNEERPNTMNVIASEKSPHNFLFLKGVKCIYGKTI